MLLKEIGKSRAAVEEELAESAECNGKPIKAGCDGAREKTK
jgi:hypothetical protein